MTRRRAVAVGSAVWAVVGSAIALASMSTVNDDAKVFVGVASIVLPLCALGAAVALERSRDRLAGVLLLVSVVTPTYFFYPVNLPALVVGIALVASPSLVLADRRGGAPPVDQVRPSAVQ